MHRFFFFIFFGECACVLSLSCFVLFCFPLHFLFGYCHHHHSSPINTKPIISVLAVTDVNFKMVFVIQYELYEWFFGCCCFCRFSAHMYTMHTNTNTNIFISIDLFAWNHRLGSARLGSAWVLAHRFFPLRHLLDTFFYYEFQEFLFLFRFSRLLLSSVHALEPHDLIC